MTLPIYLNSLLSQAGISPDSVILLRHQDASARRGRTPYELWRDDPPSFEAYQRLQGIDGRAKFSRAKTWASFVVAHDGGTLFAGLYEAAYKGLLANDTPKPHKDGIDLVGSCDEYDLKPDGRLDDLRGRLYIDWGDGTRAWVQRADNQNKVVVEVRAQFEEPKFPGFMNFIEPLSKIEALPQTWIAVLQQARGVYLLTCPKTKEQYVGSASGSEGFGTRWSQYVANNHGGNVALKSRDYTDYQVSILEVAGSSSTTDDILTMEALWKQKLQSREMGLNKN